MALLESQENLKQFRIDHGLIKSPGRPKKSWNK
jgi:hypothetical protein